VTNSAPAYFSICLLRYSWFISTKTSPTATQKPLHTNQSFADKETE